MRRLRSTVVHAAQGLLMGAADVVPGVSGGTVALVLGIFERLVAAVRALATAPVQLLRGGLTAARARLAEADWGFALPLGLGILVAVGIGARVIPGVVEAAPAGSRAVFFGLIAGSLAVPWRRIVAPWRGAYLLAGLAAVAAFGVVGLPPREISDPGLLFVFAAAAVAICAMILPGVSGAFLLLVFGVYEATLQAVSALDLPYLGVFVAGAALGLGLFSKVLGTLLERAHDATMAALVGLMAGSLRALWPWLGEDREVLAPPDLVAVAGAAGLAIAAFAAVTALILVGRRAERRRTGAGA